MKRIRFSFFCLLTVCAGHLVALAEGTDAVVPRLGDPLGEHLWLVMIALAASGAVVLLIGIVSIIRRK